nr:hypothetical protein [Tanacetum cinerariifolium]
MVRRADRQLYNFKEGDFVNLHLNDIEDMLLLVVQHKFFHLDGEVIVDLAMALRMFTRSLIINKRVKDVHLGVESYQNKLNITKPQKDFPRISAKELYTPSFEPPRFVIKTSSMSSDHSFRILLQQRSRILEIHRFRKKVCHFNYKVEGFKILSVVSVKINKLHGYGYLEEIMVRRVDRQLYNFKEGDFVNLHLNDIEDMLLLVVQHKFFHLDGEVIVDLAMALRMFTRSLIINKRVKDVHLGVESYQNKLNITKPQKDFPRISAKELYTPSFEPPRVVIKT